MIDLNKLEEKIDDLFRKETADSLTNWLLNKRLGNTIALLGTGSFVNLKGHNKTISGNRKKPNFSQSNNYSSGNSFAKQAA